MLVVCVASNSKFCTAVTSDVLSCSSFTESKLRSSLQQILLLKRTRMLQIGFKKQATIPHIVNNAFSAYAGHRYRKQKRIYNFFIFLFPDLIGRAIKIWQACEAGRIASFLLLVVDPKTRVISVVIRLKELRVNVGETFKFPICICSSSLRYFRITGVSRHGRPSKT